MTGSLLTGCSESTGSGSPSSTMEPPSAPAMPGLRVADLAELAPKGSDDILPVLSEASRAAADDLLTQVGIVELLPSAPEMLDVLGARVTETAAAQVSVGSAEPAGFRRPPVAHGVTRHPSASPAALSNRGAGLGLTALGAGIATSLSRGADGNPVNDDQTINYGEPVNFGDRENGTPAVQMKLVNGTMEMRILNRGSEPVDGGQMSVDLDVRGVVDACPSADGTVTAALSVDVRIEAVAGASTAGGRYSMELDISASVDDAASLTETVVDVFGSSSDTTTTTSDDAGTDIDGWFVEGGSRTTIAGRVADGLTVTDVEDARFTRWSANADEAAANRFLLQQSSAATAVAALTMASAEEFWRGGACVDVQLLPAGDPAAVQPGDEVLIAIEATSVVDGQPIDAPATAVATATGGSVTPPDTAQELPADVIYAVPEDGSDGEVTGRVTSRRGIGVSTLPFTTVEAFVVDGQLDVFHASGTKCGGVEGAWELALTADFQGYPFTGTLRFDLSPAGTGTYTLIGSTSGGGITVDQTGTGTVETVVASNGQQLIFTGSAWTGGPSGVRSIEAGIVADAAC